MNFFSVRSSARTTELNLHDVAAAQRPLSCVTREGSNGVDLDQSCVRPPARRGRHPARSLPRRVTREEDYVEHHCVTDRWGALGAKGEFSAHAAERPRRIAGEFSTARSFVLDDAGRRRGRG